MEYIRLLLQKNTATFLIVTTGLFILSSCKKDKNSNQIEISDVSAGGNVKLFMVDFLPGNQTVTAITLKNQASGSAGSVHVKLKIDTAVSAAGAKLLPNNGYTQPTLEYDVPANSSVAVPLTINRSNLPPDAVYGIGFKIETTSSGTVSTSAGSIIVKFDMRNKFDGFYRITGTMVDIAAPTITGYFPQDVAVTTSGPNSVTLIPKDLGIPGVLILSGTSLSYYGSFGPVLNFNSSTNQIISVVNSYGQPASNTRSAEIDATGLNVWDPATKNIYVKFVQKQPNTVTTAPNIRVYFNFTMTYQGPRF